MTARALASYSDHNDFVHVQHGEAERLITPMSRNRALVVDDSKTARVTLSRVLSGFDLEVDMADSAEGALEYLQHTRPDVIFMDHMMPGMDGFEAVKVIKDDPRTATIPIMMYTTKSGEVYVGQARALGAIGVLPKEVKPADLETVLRGLNLVTQRPRLDRPSETPERKPSPGAEAKAEPSLSEAAQELERYADDLVTTAHLREVLDQQHRRLSEDIDARVEQALARFAETRDRLERRYLYLGLGVLGLALVLIPMWTVEVYTNSQDVAVRDTLEEARAPIAAEPPVRDARAEIEAVRRANSARMLETVSWALNHSMEYDYGEIPLDGARLDTLRELLIRLNDLNIDGTLHLDVHNGTFCLQRDEFDSLSLADQALAVTDCDPIALTEETIPTPEQSQSLAFANFLATSPLVQNGGVQVQVHLVGRAEPRIDYPELASSPTAGEWNAAARRNNRVEIRFAPSSG